MSKAYKGFDKNMKCRDFQYKVGEDYKTKATPSICEKGFHACEHPLDVLNYYPITNDNIFAEVAILGKTSKKPDEDSKVVTNHIKIVRQLALKELITASVNYVLTLVKATTGSYANSATTGNCANSATTGDYANSATTGNYANSATTGDCANSATTGDYANSATTGNCANSATTGNCANSATTGSYANSATTGNYANSATTGNYANSATTGNCANSATTGDYANSATTGNCANSATSGKECISAGLGINNTAKGAVGNWLVLSEWVQDTKFNWHIKTVKTTKVDGKTIKADTYYKLDKDEFVEA